MEPECHYCVKRSPALVPMLTQIKMFYGLPTELKSILILSSHLRLGHPSSLFPSGFSTETMYAPLLYPIRATRPVLIMQYSPFSCYHFLVRPKYLSQHSVLEHPQPTFLPECFISLLRPSFWGRTSNYTDLPNTREGWPNSLTVDNYRTTLPRYVRK